MLEVEILENSHGDKYHKKDKKHKHKKEKKAKRHKERHRSEDKVSLTRQN
jgi:hypothetical protein